MQPDQKRKTEIEKLKLNPDCLLFDRAAAPGSRIAGWHRLARCALNSTALFCRSLLTCSLRYRIRLPKVIHTGAQNIPNSDI
jgi:hypothetical protein